MAELKKILHVDDDEDIRVITKMALEVVGDLEVVQCASGSEALSEAQSVAPDLFLLDVMMPEMSGEETYSKLKALEGMGDVPVIFMTAKAYSEDTQSLRDAGAIGVIVKPFDPMTLCQDIRSAFEGQAA